MALISFEEWIDRHGAEATPWHDPRAAPAASDKPVDRSLGAGDSLSACRLARRAKVRVWILRTYRRLAPPRLAN